MLQKKGKEQIQYNMRKARNSGRKTGFVSILLCLVFALSLFPGTAFAAREKTVRVGFFSFDGYHMRDEAGGMSGYGYDIVRYMAEYSKLEFVFEGYEASWSKAQDMLEAGDIDMLTSAQMTAERLERFDFSNNPIGISSAMLTVKAGNTAYISGDYSHWSGMRVGMIKGSRRNADLAAFAVEQGFTYTGVFYEDVDSMLAALASGREIDAALTSNLRRRPGEWILAQFAPSPFYVMVRKGNSELLGEINRAVGMMYAAMPNIDSLLMKKYYLANGGSVAFSAAEQAVIDASAAAPVTVGVLAETPPLCYLDAASGEYLGISMEMLRLVCKNTGLHLKFESMDLAQNAPVGFLRAGKMDLVAGILKVQTFINDSGLVLSEGIVSDSVVMVGRKGCDFTQSPGEKTLALVLGFQVGNEYVAAHFPDHNTVMYDSFAECMDAVASGEADALIYLRTCASYFLSNPRYESLEIIPAYSMDVVTCTAGIAGRDTLLMSVIDKGLSMISDGERNAVIMEHTLNHPYKPSFLETAYQHRAPLLIVGISLVFMAAAAILFFIMRRKNARRLMTAYERAKDALELAENANASKSRFFSRMSHEMRTPLNAIIGYNTISEDVLSKVKNESDYKDAATKALDCVTKGNIASRHLLTVINDVLDMSAIESGKFRIVNEPFDFRGALSTLTVLFFSQAREKGVKFDVTFDAPTDEWFIGDQMRLNQILTNLLSNAVKFTPEGKSVSLSISAVPQNADTALVRFTVADTGIGMSKDYLQNIWRPFEQADSSISRRFGGTGLGLTITKSLVDMMGGAITVKSEAGAGSVFTVEIPLGRMEQPQKDVIYDFSDFAVLIVDDDPSTRDYLRLLFSRYHVKSAAVSSGREAIAAVREGIAQNQSYSLCLIDWNMPEMSGAETIRRIRETAGSELPIIVISAYDLSDAAAEACVLGVDNFIGKPLFQSTIFDMLVDISGQSYPAAAEQRSARDFGGARVLLAEDNKMNMEIAKTILSFWNLTVDEAWNGAEAVAKFTGSSEGTYKLILMDVHMPEMDGYQATQAIRRLKRADAAVIPILAMTADVFAEDVAEAMAAGMNAHIGKPIDTAALGELLNKYIES